jgi:hypothetical protein
MRELEFCQEEVHHPKFYDQDGNIIPHIAHSRDHLTPRCLIRYDRLDRSLFTSKENLIPANNLCHALKDAMTPKILYQRKLQREGLFLGIGEHYG